jgi:hypothetical protein
MQNTLKFNDLRKIDVVPSVTMKNFSKSYRAHGITVGFLVINLFLDFWVAKSSLPEPIKILLTGLIHLAMERAEARCKRHAISPTED